MSKRDQPLWKKLGLPRPRGLAKIPKPGEKKPRARPVQWEEQYQLLVAQTFEWALPPLVVWFAVPNGGWRTKGIAARLKACGVKAGVGDIVILYDGTHHEMELKVRNGSQSDDQRKHMERVILAGGKYAIVRDTLEAAFAQLDAWGIPHAKISFTPTPEMKRGPAFRPNPVR